MNAIDIQFILLGIAMFGLGSIYGRKTASPKRKRVIAYDLRAVNVGGFVDGGMKALQADPDTILIPFCAVSNAMPDIVEISK